MNKYLVIGNPIEHSLSPKLHNFWFKANNIKAIYDKKKINKNEIQNFILDAKKSKISGVNVTVPFKKEVIQYLDELSHEAKVTQSVNTIYFKEEKIVGHNTDIEGFELGIKQSKFDLINKKIFILGAGGVVPSIIFALNKMNAAEIIVSNRTKNKANDLKKTFNNLKIIDWGEVPEFDMIINATSLGLNNDDKINLNFSKVGKNRIFYDIIYNPAETNFLKEGKRLGNITENGKMMFIYQAFAAFKIWHGIEPKINNDVLNLFDK
jgi:shikimate dehydrogenase|tara:strand:- start:84 stop:878 length:795 start_codon:yes stop_codon:yes gene_type:complete